MTLPTGTITFSNLQTEYGGSNPISLSEYYSDGTYVPIGATSIPASGAIDMNTFRGKNIAPNYVNNGVYTYGGKFGMTYYYYGWLPSYMGSMNDVNVQYPIYTPKFGNGTVTIQWHHCYYDTQTSTLTIQCTGDFRSSGPDYFRVGTQVIARTSFTRTYSNPRTTLNYGTSNPFGTTASRRVRVTNYYTAYGESPG
jgi:hypothetical protein